MEVNFTYEVKGLSVNFNDASPGTNASWCWDFGDNTPKEKTQNPTHTYLTPGIYSVVLSAVDENGDISSNIQLLSIDIFKKISVKEYLEAYLPPGLIILEPVLTNLIRTHQLNIGPISSPKIPDEDIYDDTKWPQLHNALVAKLVIRDAYMKSATGAMILAMAAGTVINGQQSQVSLGKKSIETGPTKVEWHDASTLIKAFLNSNATKGGSLFDQIDNDLCYLSSRIRVQLPFCPRLKPGPIPIVKSIPKHHHHGISNGPGLG